VQQGGGCQPDDYGATSNAQQFPYLCSWSIFPSRSVTGRTGIDPGRDKFPMSEGAAYDRLNHLGPSGGMDNVVYADDPGQNDPVITARGLSERQDRRVAL
jgi:hypothetical protein